MGEQISDDSADLEVEKLIETGLETIANAWRKRDSNSEMAFQVIVKRNCNSKKQKSKFLRNCLDRKS